VLTSIYEGVYTDINMDPRHRWKAYYHLFFLLRRLLFVTVMIFLNEYMFI
jgi:hypothetical protein